MHLRISSAKWRQFCLGINVLIIADFTWVPACINYTKLSRGNMERRSSGVSYNNTIDFLMGREPLIFWNEVQIVNLQC